MLKNSVTQIYAGSRVIGKVRGDTFSKVIRGSIHFLRKPPAIAFDVSAIDLAEQAGAVRVKVTDRETGIVYTSSIEHIREKGFTFNRGYGEQIALSLDGGWMLTRRGRLPEYQPTLFKSV